MTVMVTEERMMKAMVVEEARAIMIMANIKDIIRINNSVQLKQAVWSIFSNEDWPFFMPCLYTSSFNSGFFSKD
jgi:hypothetical protein